MCTHAILFFPELQRQKPQGLVMLRNASSYWQTNLFETTSGNFATALLRFHIDQIGLDRIMYSVDYPFVRCFLHQNIILTINRICYF